MVLYFRVLGIRNTGEVFFMFAGDVTIAYVSIRNGQKYFEAS